MTCLSIGNYLSRRFPPAKRPRVILYLSVGLIIGSWVYAVLSVSHQNEVVAWTLMRLFRSVVIKTVIVLSVVYSLLKLGGEDFAGIGLARKNWADGMLPGVILGAGYWGFVAFLLGPFLRNHFPRFDNPDLSHWFQGKAAIPIWFFIACIGGGLDEETPRCFVLTRFEKAFGKPGLLLVLPLQALAFSFGHVYQGTIGAISAGLTGFVFALIYLRRRSGWEAVIAHATFDCFGAGYAIWQYATPS